MLEMMKEHLAAFSEGDWDAYKARLAPDVVYEEIATQQRITGADNYVEFVRRWKRAFPDLKATVIGGVETGDQAIAEVEWEGTHTGPFEGPFGAVPPTNQRGTLRAVIVAKMTNGKVSETHHYFDLLTLLSQLGIVPAATPPSPSAKPAQAPATRH